MEQNPGISTWTRLLTKPCLLSLGPLALPPACSWAGQASLSEQMSRRVRALFGAMNFWAIIMYNLVSLNSLEFTELVARRLLLTGERLHSGDPGMCQTPSSLLGPTEGSPGPTPATGDPVGKPRYWRRRAGVVLLLWASITPSSHRVPPDHPGCAVCDLLWCPTGEGA